VETAPESSTSAPEPVEVAREAPKRADAAPVETARKAPPVAGRATLKVKTSPWSAVELDGRPLGKSPLVQDVSAGSHQLTLRCGKCASPMVEEKVVELGVGDTVFVTHTFPEEP